MEFQPFRLVDGQDADTVHLARRDGLPAKFFFPIGNEQSGAKIVIYRPEYNLKNYWKVNGVLPLPWRAYAEMINNVIISDGILDIGRMAFYGCSPQENINFVDSVSDIALRAHRMYCASG